MPLGIPSNLGEDRKSSRAEWSTGPYFSLNICDVERLTLLLTLLLLLMQTKLAFSVPPTIEYEPYNNNAVPAPEKPAVITQHAPPPSNSTAADNKAAGASQTSQQKVTSLISLE